MKKTKRTSFLSLMLAILMIVSMLPVGMLSASSATTADTTWYSGATMLYVSDAADLWAFAKALNSGTNFAGQTIKLTKDITVNAGWNAFAATVTKPTDVWPLTGVNKYFAGTFDGQGYTISGLYANVTTTGSYGFFGNVATGTTATVKNLTIENSYLQTVYGRTGGIFGEICQETNTAITNLSYVNKTHGYIDHVHLNINIYAAGGSKTNHGGSNNGVGGFVGINRTDLTITNSSFHGQARSNWRGVAAFLGSSYPAMSSSWDHDGDGASTPYYKNASGSYVTTAVDLDGDGSTSDETKYYFKNNVAGGTAGTAPVGRQYYRSHTVIENCVNTGSSGQYSNDSYGINGALVGYANSNTDIFTFKNIFSAGTVSGSTTVGYIFGGTHCAATNYRTYGTANEVTEYQEVTFENVNYLKTCGDYAGFGKTTTGQKIEGMPIGHTKADLENLIRDSLKQSLTLKNDLSLNIYVTVIDPNAVVTINGETVEGVAVDGLTKRYSLNGILPQQMRDTYTVKVTQTIADKTVTVQKTTSIRKYCDTLWNSDIVTKQEKDLLADLLRYGAAAQTYSEYQTDRLATAGMNLTGYGTTVSASNIATKYALTTSTLSGYGFLGATLRLENSLAMSLKFQATSTENLKVSISINGRKTTLNADDFLAAGAQTYVVNFENLNAHEMDATITAKLLNGSTTVQTLTYSVADYCKSILTANADGNEKLAADQTLVERIYAYGLSAVGYNDENRQVITTDYVIVYDDSDAVAKEIAQQFAADLEKKTGLALSVVADTTANAAKEIIIGAPNGRSEAKTELNKLTALNDNGYRISIVGNDIVVVSGSRWLLEYAAQKFLGDLRTHGGTTWGVELDYSAQMDVPTYSTSQTVNVYYADEQNHTWSITGTTASEYNAYINTLKSNGFVEHTTNKIGTCVFGTYVNTSNGSNTVAYTMWYPNSKNARITYGPLRYLPGTEEVSAGATGIRAIPSIIQNARETIYGSAPGMAFVIQLLDGSFILIDGGNADQVLSTKTKNGNTWTTNAAAKTEDAKKLYDLLVELSPDEKPVIALWYVTHAHGDHMGMTNQFLQTYHADVDLEMVAYNFPDFVDSVTITNDSNGKGMKNLVDTFKQLVRVYYPDAEEWVLHTGQKQYLPGCEVEVFYTPEDYYGTNTTTTETFPWGNHTCNTVRITLGDTTFLVLGDTEKTLCAQMATNYGSAVQSDIMQATHHGANGGELTFYQYVDPKIVFWPMDEYRFENDGRCLGIYRTQDEEGAYTVKVNEAVWESYRFNYWLRTEDPTWNRSDGTSGTRKHYAVSTTQMTRIYCSYPTDFTIQTTFMPLA